MSPLAAPPVRGYADYQRVDNYDTDLIYNFDTGVISTVFSTPVVDCSRFAYLMGQMNTIGSKAKCVVQWYSDPLGSVTIATRTFFLDSPLDLFTEWHIPHMGPFVNIQFFHLPAGTYRAIGVLFNSNRVHPLEFIPHLSVLIDQQGVALAASATNTFAPADYFAGPMSVYWSATVQAFMTVNALNSAGGYDIIYESPVVAANTASPNFVIAPTGAWNVGITNQTAGAGAMNLSVVPSTTGAN